MQADTHYNEVYHERAQEPYVPKTRPEERQSRRTNEVLGSQVFVMLNYARLESIVCECLDILEKILMRIHEWRWRGRCWSWRDQITRRRASRVSTNEASLSSISTSLILVIPKFSPFRAFANWPRMSARGHLVFSQVLFVSHGTRVEPNRMMAWRLKVEIEYNVPSKHS